MLRARTGKNGGQAPKGKAANEGGGDGGNVEQSEAKCFEHDGVLASARAEGFCKAAKSQRTQDEEAPGVSVKTCTCVWEGGGGGGLRWKENAQIEQEVKKRKEDSASAIPTVRVKFYLACIHKCDEGDDHHWEA